MGLKALKVACQRPKLAALLSPGQITNNEINKNDGNNSNKN